MSLFLYTPRLESQWIDDSLLYTVKLLEGKSWTLFLLWVSDLLPSPFTNLNRWKECKETTKMESGGEPDCYSKNRQLFRLLSYAWAKLSTVRKQFIKLRYSYILSWLIWAWELCVRFRLDYSDTDQCLCRHVSGMDVGPVKKLDVAWFAV